MTGCAISNIVVFRLFSCMTGFAIGWCSFINAIRVAICAFDRGVLAHQWIESVLAGKTARRKWYGHGIDSSIGII